MTTESKGESYRIATDPPDSVSDTASSPESRLRMG